MNEIVKYHNDINKISFAGFNEKELNLFFSLIFLAKEKGTMELTIPFSDLKNLSNDLDRNKQRFIDNLNNVNKKLIALHHQIKVDDTTYTFSLFNVFGVNEKENVLTVEVNKIFSYMLNDLIGNFTKFELENFVNLKSSYSKNMFKILKQWERVKEKIFSVDELKNLLNAPVAYDTFKFNQKIIKQLENDLPPFFPNLKIEKIKKGRVIKSYKFTWSKQQQDINYVDDVEIEISEELQKAFEKASHNRFIQPFLTEDNKAELIEFFEDEKILIKGLIYAYKKIDKEFKRLSYLIKTIKTGAEQQTKTIKVVKKDKTDITIEDIQNDNIRQTSFDEIVPQPKAEEKERVLKEIYEDDFENLYKEYLKNNNADDRPYVRKCFAMPYKIIKREPKKEEKNLSPLEKIFTKDSKVNIVIKKGKKVIFDTSKIPEEMLLGKNGKKLVGVALQMRIKKIINDINKKEVK